MEILFRGKRVDNGEWVVGLPLETSIKDYVEYGSSFYIVRGYAERDIDGWSFISNLVDSETVGQYTGLTVPSGKIFEHDIVIAKIKSNGARFNFTVKYSNKKGCYVFDNGSVKVPFDDIRSVRIIGNIHDNPELLGDE